MTETTTATLEDLLKLQWNNDAKMVAHCLKHCLYIQSGDTFIRVGDRKPSIDADMWYDDETEGPEENFENFRQYNLRSNAPTPLRETAYFITANYYQDKTNGRLASFTINRGEVRPATAEEIELANQALASARADYEKRLVNYWKRYSNKVRARGYWANR